MKNIINTMQIGFTAVGGYLGWFLGGLDGFLYALILFVVIDYITGLMVAILEKKISSEVGFKGIFKKVLIFTMVAIGHSIDSYIIQNGSAVRTAVIFFYLSNEGISIIENASKMGLPIPEKLKVIFDELKNDK
ncbi:phage holin family protein [Caloranaerobacter ferrireducens]|uniref:phage holin family protein n=1 Tax=Caloranaerobacter ferrireducens TaxID=1323370 RepID=UPI00084DE761|nr:phage holin family protein [Caloranaerobacter ferrireducens]